MQKEIASLDKVFAPKRPLVAVVAGSKFDTKIGPLAALLEIADHLVLGGVIYNAYLAAKYDINVSGLSQEDVDAARKFIEDSQENIHKIVELPSVVLCQSLQDRNDDHWDAYQISDLKDWDQSEPIGYILDADSGCVQNAGNQADLQWRGHDFRERGDGLHHALPGRKHGDV
jgi:phosphoglycerate kinase